MKHHFSISLTVQGPILTKSSNPTSFGLDAAVARATHGESRGQPCLPGTHMEGKIREAWEQLGYGDTVTRLLGRESPDGTDDQPERGRLQIGDLVAAEETKPRLTRHRIALEQELGSVKHGALQVIETPYAAGAQVTFTGAAWAFGGDAKALREQLQLGLSFLTHFGSGRSIGLGRLLKVEVTHLKSVALPTPVTGTGTPATLRLTLQPQGPLCISRHKMDENLYASEDFIPGNMVAGALVETWAASFGLRPGASAAECAAQDPSRALLARHFDRLRFRHAFPAPLQNSRPRAIPLSWAKSGDKLYDVASLPAARLLPNFKGELLAPAFLLDWKWKDFERANEACGRHSPARELRVRTSIDSGKRTADRGENGEGGKLFAWELIHPETDDTTHTVLAWHGAVDLTAVPEAERAAVAAQLQGLLADLAFVSKTKAACPGLVTETEAETAPPLSQGGTLHLVLQTPALLADPRFQKLPNVPTHDALDATAMTALYREVWLEISDGSLELSHHFARQQLAGGKYLATRYQKGKAYNPWLLTTEGSVFAFKVIDAEKAAACLTVWLQTGLPLPQWAKDTWGDSWRTNPFLPQNGFGEVAVHQTHPDFPLPTP